MLFFLNILTNQVSPSVATLILVKYTLISWQLLDDANYFTRNLKSICRSFSWFLGLLVQLWGVRLFVCSTNLFRLRSLHSRQRENVSWNIKQTKYIKVQTMSDQTNSSKAVLMDVSGTISGKNERRKSQLLRSLLSKASVCPFDSN